MEHTQTMAVVADDTTTVFRAAAELATRKGGRLVAMTQFPSRMDDYMWMALVQMGDTKWVVWDYNVEDAAYYSGWYFDGDGESTADAAYDARRRAYRAYASLLGRRMAGAFGTEVQR